MRISADRFNPLSQTERRLLQIRTVNWTNRDNDFVNDAVEMIISILPRTRKYVRNIYV